MRVAFVTEGWIASPWRAGDPSLPQPRYIGSWERDDAFEWGPGWGDLAQAVVWGRARAPLVRVALARTDRERLVLSVGRDALEALDVLVEESARAATEIPWPDALLEGFGGQVDIHEASGHWDRTGEYAGSVVQLEQELADPDDLHELASETLSGSPFTDLGEAVQRAARECPVVIVRHGPPVGAIFFSAGREEPVGLRLPRLPDGWL